MSSGGRETKDPRNEGMAQKVQRRSQPLAIFSGAQGRSSRRWRSTAYAGPPSPGTGASSPWPLPTIAGGP